VIRKSYYYDMDTFIARSASRGISNYPETYELDTGDAFPDPPASSSNVSVLYNPVPEPGLAPLAALLALGTGTVRFRAKFKQ
jgi:hypothetical protein